MSDQFKVRFDKEKKKQYLAVVLKLPFLLAAYKMVQPDNMPLQLLCLRA